MLAQHGLVGPMNTPLDMSYLSDAVLMLRYFEYGGMVRRALSVVKKRSGNHEHSIREFRAELYWHQRWAATGEFPRRIFRDAASTPARTYPRSTTSMSAADTADARILILAPTGRDAIASADLLRRAGMQADVCKDLEELTSRIDAAALAVLLAEEALFGKDISVLSERVGNQPPWSDLPFVVLTSNLPSTSVTAWRHRLVESLRNVSLLERPVQAITLRTAMQAAVRARARQYEMRALLETQEHAAAELEHLVLARTHQLQTANEELRQQMTERARIEESLRQAQRMEAIGQLTGGIAHDFNNLLMVILGGLTMLDRNKEPARRQMLLHGIQQAAQRGAALTRQLLAFSRKQPLQAHSSISLAS